MDLEQIMKMKNFVVVGNTLVEEKYAYKIKSRLELNGYTTYGVDKELASINDVPGDIDVIDLCIHPVKGLKLLKECTKPFQCIVIQPGAESKEIFEFLDQKKWPYIEGCLLLGMDWYCK